MAAALQAGAAVALLGLEAVTGELMRQRRCCFQSRLIVPDECAIVMPRKCGMTTLAETLNDFADEHGNRLAIFDVEKLHEQRYVATLTDLPTISNYNAECKKKYHQQIKRLPAGSKVIMMCNSVEFAEALGFKRSRIYVCTPSKELRTTIENEYVGNEVIMRTARDSYDEVMRESLGHMYYYHTYKELQKTIVNLWKLKRRQ